MPKEGLLKITTQFLVSRGACMAGLRWFDSQGLEGESLHRVLETLSTQSFREWAQWLLMSCMDREKKVKTAAFAARKVLPIYEAQFPGDLRPRRAVDVLREDLSPDAVRVWGSVARKVMEGCFGAPRAVVMAVIRASEAKLAEDEAAVTELAGWAFSYAVRAAEIAATGWQEEKSAAMKLRDELMRFGLSLLEGKEINKNGQA